MISLQNHLMKTYSENQLASMLSLKLSSSLNSNTKLHAQCHNGLLITKFKSFLSFIVLAVSTNINTGDGTFCKFSSLRSSESTTNLVFNYFSSLSMVILLSI